jgi:peptide-methionine (S)-S-oxide reductase
MLVKQKGQTSRNCCFNSLTGSSRRRNFVMKHTVAAPQQFLDMNRIPTFIPAILFFTLLLSCDRAEKPNDSNVWKVDLSPPPGRTVAAFASGCFWCTEHIFEAVPGVDSAVSGYAGGSAPNPTYELVNTETTGHAETVLVYYNPETVSFEELTNVFFTSHDPTTPNRQGPDVGSSYRSILFYQTDEEKEIAENAIRTFSGSFENPIVTEIKRLTEFYRAEGYHQDYVHHNPNSPYVRGVSIPRYEQFKRTYKGELKPDA